MFLRFKKNITLNLMLSRRIKNQLLRIISGILFFPIGPAILIYNESKAIHNDPLWAGVEYEGMYWVIRLMATLFIIFCLYRIFSAAKLFMMKIPLTYNEIRAGIYLVAILTGFMLSLLCISLVWLYHKPLISIVLIGISVILMIILFIKRGQNKKQKKVEVASVKPHQSKDV